jgi:hypothetical protein
MTRYACIGWTGTGSVPPAGATNRVEFVIAGESALNWQWNPAYQLVQTSSVPGLLSTSTWWRIGTGAQTVRAAEQVAAGGTNYRFCAWYVDGARRPDPTNAAQNPAGPIAMGTSHTAQALYLPADRDSDGNGLPDWWENYYFGSGGAVANVDDDGDGFSNQMEFMDRSNPRDRASWPRAPAIAHTPLASVQSRPAPWNVAAVVTDSDVVQSVALVWSRNGAAPSSVPMLPGGGTNYYTNAIPAPGVTGDRIEYRIVAFDRAGLEGDNGPYTVDVRYPLASVSPTNLGLLRLPANSSTALVLSVMSTGHSNLEWKLEVHASGIVDGAENGENGWTHSGRNDVWHISQRRAYSGASAWYFGSEQTALYPDSAKGSLVSPPILLEAESRLSFQQWLYTEELKDPTHAWDGGIVEISTNDGATYAQIAPTGGYPYTIFGHSASAFSNETPCFAGTGGWEAVEFDLSAYAGQEVRLRFTLGSDGYVVNEGWYIDDVKVLPSGQKEGWLIVAPTNGVLPPQSQRGVWVTVRTAAVPPAASRSAYLKLVSNDPLAPTRAIPVRIQNISRSIAVTKSGEGRVAPSGTVYVVAGATTNFVLTAHAYHHVAAILTNGVQAAGQIDTAVAEFVWSNITANGTLHALFRPNLTSNQVPEAWLAAYGLTNDFGAAAGMDQDGDSMMTWQEYIAGTDPTNPASLLLVTGCESMGTNASNPVGAIVLRWISASNRQYRLYGGSTPGAPLQEIGNALPATPPVNTHTDQMGAAGFRFYRVGASIAP